MEWEQPSGRLWSQGVIGFCPLDTRVQQLDPLGWWGAATSPFDGDLDKIGGRLL